MSNPSPYDESHLNVLRFLEADPGLSQRELAEAMGVSLGKVNYCIRALLDRGLLEMKGFHNNQNRPAYAYLLTPAGISAKADLTVSLLEIKLREYKLLQQEIDILRREIQGQAV